MDQERMMDQGEGCIRRKEWIRREGWIRKER